jgi:hypothetical protein
MKPLVLLSKIHEDFSMPLGSMIDCCTVFRHWTSRSEPKHDDEQLNSSNQRTNSVLSTILDMDSWPKIAASQFPPELLEHE